MEAMDDVRVLTSLDGIVCHVSALETCERGTTWLTTLLDIMSAKLDNGDAHASRTARYASSAAIQ
jgi:hypothetical protein